MNIQSIIRYFKLRRLHRIDDDLDSAMESICYYADLISVDEYGAPLPYETELRLIGGSVKNIFEIDHPIRYEVVIHIFDSEEEKRNFQLVQSL